MDAKRHRVAAAEDRAFAGDPSGAAALIRGAASEDPGDPELWFLLGHYLRSARDLGGAARALNEAVAINQDHGMAHHELANCLRDMGQLDVASGHYRRAIDLLDDEADPIADYGLWHQLSAETDLATAMFRRSLEIDSTCVPAQLGLVRHHLDAGETEAALARSDEIVRLQPELPEALLIRARVLEVLGEIELATASITRSLHHLGEFGGPLAAEVHAFATRFGLDPVEVIAERLAQLARDDRENEQGLIIPGMQIDAALRNFPALRDFPTILDEPAVPAIEDTPLLFGEAVSQGDTPFPLFSDPVSGEAAAFMGFDPLGSGTLVPGDSESTPVFAVQWAGSADELPPIPDAHEPPPQPPSRSGGRRGRKLRGPAAHAAGAGEEAAVTRVEQAIERPNPFKSQVNGNAADESEDLVAVVNVAPVEAKSKDPKVAEWLKQARTHAAGGQWQKAAESAELALGADPEDAEATLRLGEALAKMRSFERAVPLLERALQRSEGRGEGTGVHSEALSLLAEVLVEKKDAMAAYRVGQTLQRLYPNQARTLFLSGRISHLNGDLRQAIRSFKEAARLDPEGAIGLSAKESISALGG